MLVTALIILNTMLLLTLITFMLKFKASLPDIEQVLVDVGGSISEQLKEVFANPQVSRAMSILGKKSGDVRASKALKNKVAEKALGQNVLMKKALEYLDITPLEGLELMGDPTFGPVVRNLMAGFQKGSSKFLGGLGNSPGSNPGRGYGVPVMS